MSWSEQYTKADRPEPVQIGAYIASPLWEDLRSYLEATYAVAPSVEHSVCSGAPGWNVKYKRGSRALCTLYPARGYFTCMVSIGAKEAMEAELLLAGCTDYVRDLYWNSRPFNSGRWLMIEVRSPDILRDVKVLIGTRVKGKQVAKHN